MGIKIESARIAPCKIVFFRERPYIKPNQVLFIDNRPGREHSYHDKLVDVFGLLRNSKLDISDENIPILREIIERGLRNGGFKDTTRAAEWLGSVNQYANFLGFNIEPFELLIAHAEDHIHEIIKIMVIDGNWPAGMILSGSPKMLSEVLTDTIIQQTLRLICSILDKKIPILGFCFGLHLLAYSKFGALAEYIHVPEGMGVEFHPKLEAKNKFTNSISGDIYTVYGTSFVRRVVKHKVLAAVDKIFGLEVHSQFLSSDHPSISNKKILAVSKRFFRENKMSKKQYEQVMIEVLEVGEVAIGTQLHPELQPELLLALSYLPEISSWLKNEGQDLQRLRKELGMYPKSFYAGQRIGYNWVKRILAPDYIRKMISDEKSQRTLLDRLKYRDLTRNRFSVVSENFF